MDQRQFSSIGEDFDEFPEPQKKTSKLFKRGFWSQPDGYGQRSWINGSESDVIVPVIIKDTVPPSQTEASL